MKHAWLTVLLSAALLAACDDNTQDARSAGPLLHVAGSPGRLQFSWDPVDGADTYRLYRRTGELGIYNQVGSDTVGHSMTLDVVPHDLDWEKTQFRLDACRGSRCVASAPVAAGIAMLGTIRSLHALLAAPDARFGFQLALSGDGNTLAVWRRGNSVSDTVIDDCGGAGISCVLDAGAVDVFVRNAGNWQLQATLRAPTPGAGDNFGEALAISADGNTLAIGAAGDDASAPGIIPGASMAVDACNGTAPSGPSCAGESGVVFVFTRNIAANWMLQATIKADNPQPGDLFGDELALSADGNRLLVGAMHKQNPAGTPQGGMAFVYARAGTAWSTVVQLSDPDATHRDFGDRVTISGDGNRVGVVSYDTAGTTGYVHLIDGNAGWTGTSTGPYVGLSAAIPRVNALLNGDGTVLVIAIPVWRSAAIYREASGNWTLAQQIEPAFGGYYTGFGASLAMTPDASSILVGAYRDGSFATGITRDPAAAEYSCDSVNHPDCALDSGAMHLFRFDTATQDWRDPVFIKAPEAELFHDLTVPPGNAPSADFFGQAVAISDDGSVIAGGASLDDSDATGTLNAFADGCEAAVPFACARNAGAVYIY